MKILKNNIVFLVLLFVISFLAGLNLLKPGYFSMHDDVQVMRLFEMEKCFKDGQIPCRWVPDMGAGYGHPLFNYHPVFVYYFGMLFRILGFSFIDTSKLLFFFSILLSSLFMYVLTKEFFGKLAGFIGASIYVLAPYHAVDIYVRGALTESWAIAFFPLIFWSIFKYLHVEKLDYFFLSIFSIFLLLITHNTMPLIFIPIVMVWGLFWLSMQGKWHLLLKFLLIFVWGSALSAFFLLPSLLEINLAKLETMTTTYYDFRNHFVTIRQLLFDRSWGYGPSIQGPTDSMSFQLGWPIWVLALFSVLLSIYYFFYKKEHNFIPSLLVLLSILFASSVFMAHSKSFFVWDKIPGISFVQFPWRFLALAIFTMSILIAGLISFVKLGKWRMLIGLIVLFFVLIFNLPYFKPGVVYPEMTDQKKLSGKEWQMQAMATLNDYVPRQVIQMPSNLAPEGPWVVEGEGKITEFQKRSDFWQFAVNAISEEGVVVEVPVFNFPRWDIFLNTEKIQTSSNSKTGVIQVFVPRSEHTVVTGWFRNTLLRKIANAISIVSFSSLVLFVSWYGYKNDKSMSKRNSFNGRHVRDQS